jgi:integrase
MKLTAKRTERLKHKPGRYHDGHGLYLQVVNDRNQSWLLRYERHGKEHWYGLGPLHTVGLKDARELARIARLRLLVDGIDPIEARRAREAAAVLAAAKRRTFKECTEAYLTANRGSWRSAKHGRQWGATVAAYAYPKIGNLAVADIDTGLVLKCVEPIWQDRTVTAQRVLGRIQAVLDWATVRKYRQGDNPARWKGHLEHVLPARDKLAKRQHYAALPYAEIPAFMAALRERQGMAARALEFTVETAARSGEVLGAQWSEINLADKLWIIPAQRMKAGREHRVVLSDRMVALLGALPTEDTNSFVFIGPRGSRLSKDSLAVVLTRMDHGDITVHGFRSTYRDWCAERTNYPPYVVEMALAHAVGDRVEAAYRRGDLLVKRRQLAEAWSKYCCSPPPAGGAVVPLRQGAPA